MVKFKEHIIQEQIDELYYNTKYSLFSIFILLSIIAIVLYLDTRNSHIGLWYATLLFLLLLRIIAKYKYEKNKKLYKKYYIVFLILSSFTAIAISSIFFIAFPQEKLLQAFLFFMIGGISAGAITTLSYSLVAIFLYQSLLLIPTIIKTLLLGTPIYYVMAFALTLFYFMMLQLSYNSYKHYRTLLLLKKKYDKKSELLSIQQQRFEHFFNNIPIGIFFYNSNYTLLNCNKYFAHAVGSTREKLIGFNIKKILDKRIFPALEAVFKRKIGFYRGEYITTHSHRKYFIELFTAPVRLHSNVIEGVGVVFDVTKLHHYQKRIEKLAFYDELTGLAKRSLLLENLDFFLTKAKREHLYSALIFIDLDNFKDINDSLGHNIGDLFLVEIARRIKQSIRQIDIAARLGGDEFAILLTNLATNKNSAMKEALEISQKVLDEIKKPMKIDNKEIKTSASIGIVLLTEEIQDAYEALRYADSAMYRIKKASKDNIQIYNKELQKELDNLYTLKDELENALQKDELTLYLQPQYDKDKKIIGAECLLRWVHPTKGTLVPHQFLYVAYEFNLIAAITQKVLQLVRELFEKMDTKVKLAINVSGTDIYAKKFLHHLSHIITPPMHGYLEIEITEEALVQDIHKAINTMQELKDKYKIQISIDDFGTGYSSLQYLKKLPVDCLKIDKSFVIDMLKDRSDYEIVQTIVNMAHIFGLQTVAEGVESQAHFTALRTLGVDCFQGYYLAKPMPIQEFLELLD